MTTVRGVTRKEFFLRMNATNFSAWYWDLDLKVGYVVLKTKNHEL